MPSSTMDRRRFLRIAGGMASVPLFSSLVRSAMAAGPFADYKALVCVFLYGGSDSHNLIIPTAAGEWAAYAAKRGVLALPSMSVLPLAPINAGGRTFATHPSMPKLQKLFNTDKKAAIIGNVGPLIGPTSLAQYKAQNTPLPPQLFSHSDMQSHWQSGNPAAPFSTGWGGRLADLLYTSNGAAVLPTSVSLAGSNQLMVATLPPAAPYQVSPDGPIEITAYRNWDTGGSNPQKVYEDRIAMARVNQLEDEYADIVARSIDIQGATSTALASIGSYRADFPGTGTDAESSPTVTNTLADQMRMVARLIAARTTLGTKRQIFFVSLGGFDTHGDEPTIQPKLLSALDDALDAFYRKTAFLGVANNVTTFTASDFGRTYTCNGSGSDHGWGGHQVVVGGAVKGGQLFGTVPLAALGAGSALSLTDPVTSLSLDTGQGRLLPTVASDQYAATLAQWMGVTASTELASVLPNINNFSVKNLGFLG